MSVTVDPIRSLEEFEQLKRQGKGYFVITDSVSASASLKVHHVTCSFVNTNSFKTKVMDTTNSNGEYYWMARWDMEGEGKEKHCKICM